MIRQTKREQDLHIKTQICVVDTWDMTIGDKRGMEWIRVA